MTPSHKSTMSRAGCGVRASLRALSVAPIALSFGACSSPIEPEAPRLVLSVILGKQRFFEGEPIYAVYRVANHGSDTAWISRFSLVELNLRIDVQRLDGQRMPEQGPVADYFPGPGWRGVPLAPGDVLHDMAVLQDRVGVYLAATRDLYAGNLPPADYWLRSTFYWSVDAPSRYVQSSARSLHVRSRTTEEQLSLVDVLALSSMPWDTLSRTRFPQALLEYAQRRMVEDSLDPFLPLLTGRMVGTARSVGYLPDSAMLDRFKALQARIVLGRRDEPAGVIALAALFAVDPQHVRQLAPELRGTLAGEVADQLQRRSAMTAVLNLP